MPLGAMGNKIKFFLFSERLHAQVVGFISVRARFIQAVCLVFIGTTIATTVSLIYHDEVGSQWGKHGP